MGLTTLFKEEVRDTLMGLRMTAAQMGSGAFNEGYCAALDAVAASFGLDPLTGSDGRRWRDATGTGETWHSRWELTHGRAKDATVDSRARELPARREERKNECW